MALEEQFDLQISEWKEHIRNVGATSFANQFIDCEPFRRIALMGDEVLPLVRKLYDVNPDKDLELDVIQGHGLKAVVEKIMGVENFSVPKYLWGNITKTTQYTKACLDIYLSL